MNIIDRFLYKILILTFILLLGVVLDKVSIISLESIKNDLNENINIIETIKVINGDLNIIDLGDNSISVDNDDHFVEEKNGVYTYHSNSSKVLNFSLGYVTKIFKENGFYKVFILDENNNYYCYYNLSKVNVKLYQLIKVNDIIGEAKIIEDNSNYLYYFCVIVDEN